MSLRESVNERISDSQWGQWLMEADDRARELASGKVAARRLRRSGKDTLPVQVVSLLAIADLRDIVLDLAAAIDELCS